MRTDLTVGTRRNHNQNGIKNVKRTKLQHTIVYITFKIQHTNAILQGVSLIFSFNNELLELVCRYDHTVGREKGF